MRRLLFFLAALAALSACTGVFFHPRSDLIRTPADLGLAYEEVYFHAADGVRLHAWWLPIPEDTVRRGTILFLHGNAENISTHIGSVAWLPAAGFEVFLFDYRGYGLSQGAPELDGLHLDVEAALAQVSARAPDKLVVFGQSLGGSLALTALADSPLRARVGALIADSAFAGYRQVAREKLAGFWLSWPLQWPLAWSIDDRYRPTQAIARLAPLPVLLIHGSADHTVPPAHAEQLYAAAREPKTLWLVPGAGHIEALRRPELRERLSAWLTQPFSKNSWP